MGLKRFSVVFYTGHRMRGADNPNGLPAGDEGWVASQIAAALDELRPISLCGSLASGADILCAEAATARRIPLHVWLPMGITDFLTSSVMPAGADWETRCAALLGNAATLTQIPPTSEPFTACSSAAMQHACDLAVQHGVIPVQLAIWNGRDAKHTAGTFADMTAWQARHLPTYIVNVGA